MSGSFMIYLCQENFGDAVFLPNEKPFVRHERMENEQISAITEIFELFVKSVEEKIGGQVLTQFWNLQHFLPP